MVNRIREILENRQLTPTQFADLIGVGRPVISHILSERNKPSLEVVQKVISAFPDVSLSWLMSGTGPMLVAATPADSPTAPLRGSATPEAPPASTLGVVAAPIAGPPPFTPPPVAPALTKVAAELVAVPAMAIPLVANSAAKSLRLPQPPRFRPSAAANQAVSSLGLVPPPSQPPPSLSGGEAPALVTATVISAPTPIPDLPEVAGFNLPSTPAQPAPAATPALAPELAPLPTPTPAASIESLELPATSAVAAAAPPTASPNPAAAFSFLGEAGKTIRRIVLFYSDGSFSDYRPEGQ